MPSHPDRVRRNYHTVSSDSRPIPSQCMVEIKVSLSKLAIASWVSPKEAAYMMGKEVYERVMALVSKKDV